MPRLMPTLTKYQFAGYEGVKPVIIAICIIKDDIEATSIGQSFDVINNRFISIADDFIGAATTRDFSFFSRRNRGGHVSALCLGHLNRDIADTLGSAVDQHMVTRFDTTAIN